jgi:nicotinic acid mononucleotide adenylyltransferase
VICCRIIALAEASVPELPNRLPALADRMIEPGAEHAASGHCAIFLVGASTPDVSSTDIRRRLTAGQSIAGLVPASVESHIRQHGLYSHHGRSLA